MDEKLNRVSPEAKSFVDGILLASGISEHDLELLNSSEEELETSEEALSKNVGEGLEKASKLLFSDAKTSLDQVTNFAKVLEKICDSLNTDDISKQSKEK